MIAIIPNGGTRKPHSESLTWREKWTIQAIKALDQNIRDRIDVIVGDNVEAKINNVNAYVILTRMKGSIC